jgi:hypothetical protein
MSKNKVIKSVGFNVTNEDDKTILAAVGEKNFSAYVKELILADLRGNKSEYNGPLRVIKITEQGGIKITLPPLPQDNRVTVAHG